MLKGWPRKGVDAASSTLDSIRSIRARIRTFKLRRSLARCERPPHRTRQFPVVIVYPLPYMALGGGHCQEPHTRFAPRHQRLKPRHLATLILRRIKLKAEKTFFTAEQMP